MRATEPVSGASSPKVSTIIPAYNYASYLPSAIDSALNQDFKGNEIIVVDDGSTDNTAEVVKGYGDRVRYIYQKNAGLPSARNTGIAAARSEFVAFLDADDEWCPSFLTRAMETFSRLPNEFAVVACRPIHIDKNGVPMGLKRLIPEVEKELFCQDLIFRTNFFPSAVVARRTAIQDCGGFNPVLRSSEDRDMWIRVGARYRVLIHAERLVRIRRHTSNMSKNAGRMKENIGKVLRNAYDKGFVPRTRVLFWMRVLAFYYFQTGWMFYEEGRRGQGMWDMVKSMMLWPCFTRPTLLNEPLLFRARSLLRFATRKP